MNERDQEDEFKIKKNEINERKIMEKRE